MHRFKNILCYTGSWADPTTGVTRAAELARSNDAKLTLIDVLPATEEGPWMIRPGTAKIEEVLVHQRRRDLETRAEALGDLDVTTVLRRGTVFVELVREVLRADHDILVKTAAGPGPSLGGLFSSTGLHLFRKCPCPVWVVRPGEKGPMGRVLACLEPGNARAENEELNLTILQLASSLAQRNGAHLDVLSAVWLPYESLMAGIQGRISSSELEPEISAAMDLARSRIDSMKSTLGLGEDSANVQVVHQRPDRAILEAARGADTTVLGTLSRTGVAGVFIGNTAERVLAGVGSSVLAVKPAGFETPVRVDPTQPPLEIAARPTTEPRPSAPASVGPAG